MSGPHLHTVGGSEREKRAEQKMRRMTDLGWTDLTWTFNGDTRDPWWHARGTINNEVHHGSSPTGPDTALYEMYLLALSPPGT